MSELVQAREQVTFVGRDRTGRHPPWTVYRLGTWTAPWGRRDAMVYFLAVPVLLFFLSFTGRLWDFLSPRMDWALAGPVLLVLVLGPAAVVGALVSQSKLEGRLIPRYLGSLLDRVTARLIIPRGRSREPRGRVRVRAFVLPPLSPPGPGPLESVMPVSDGPVPEAAVSSPEVSEVPLVDGGPAGGSGVAEALRGARPKRRVGVRS